MSYPDLPLAWGDKNAATFTGLSLESELLDQPEEIEGTSFDFDSRIYEIDLPKEVIFE